MGWTKQQLIEQAFGELALAGYVFDLDADTLESALRNLDTMMAEWSGLGISIGYLLPATPDDSNIGDDAGIPNESVRAVYSNLAVQLAAGRGKALTPQTMATAQRGYNTLLGAAVSPTSGQCSGLPRIGAGNKPWRCF
jgi:hypothetical protein